MREIGRNLNKLVRDLKAQQTPEAMVYLRLLGNELGYLRTSDMEGMIYSAAMMTDSMLKMLPMDVCIRVTVFHKIVFCHVCCPCLMLGFTAFSTDINLYETLIICVLQQLMKGLMAKTDNTMFVHYIFMDNEFFLPTATGVPLRIALSGTFTPGIKGGLKIAGDMVKIIIYIITYMNLFNCQTQLYHHAWYQLSSLPLCFHAERGYLHALCWH